MRAILASTGTTGDFEPLLALAVELRRRGHEPVLANSAVFATRAAQHEIEFVPVGSKQADLKLTQALATSFALQNPVAQARNAIEGILSFVPEMVHELEGICSKADVLICFPFQLAGFMVHEKIGIPYVACNFSPFGAFSGKHIKEATAAMINESRTREGLPARLDPFGDSMLSSQLALYAVSSHIFRRPVQWPVHYHLTGYFFLDEDWQPDARLAEFLTKDSPPIVLTFGSMPHPYPQELTDLLVKAIEHVGCRAIIQAGWSGLGKDDVPAQVHIARFIPHSWLFSQASCVVHHGAAGTTAAALRAGLPAVIVPHVLDQFLWAELVHALGGCSMVIPYPKLNAEKLAAAIAEALSAKSQRRARVLGEKIRTENGVSRAVQLIEQLLIDRRSR